MKKAKSARDTLRKEYTRADFPAGLVRGRYASRVSEGTNMVLLDSPPERLVVVRTGSGATANRGKKKVASRSRGRRQSR